MTDRLYQKDVYLKDFQATVTDLEADGDAVYAVLDRTAFFPEGGGQYCDIGKIGNEEVSYVFEKNGKIYHKVAPGSHLEKGTAYDCSIDWDRRFDNMQRHCGEHILTGIFYREYGGVNRGFHMGADYITIDISLEEDPAYDKITWEMAKQAELMANEVIWQDVPVFTHHYDSFDEAKDLPMRKALAIDEDITIVSIGSKESVWGSVACCGTHPATTGQVGLIKVYKVEPNKGMWRIYFEAGRRALLDCTRKLDILNEIAVRFSAGEDDVIEKINAHEEKQDRMRSEYFALRKSVIDNIANDIQNEMDGSVHTYSFDELKGDDYRALAKALKINGLIIFCDKSQSMAMLYSDGSIPCGKLVKDNAPVFGGKGGGRDDNAQVKFKNNEDMFLFADAIEKLRR